MWPILAASAWPFIIGIGILVLLVIAVVVVSFFNLWVQAFAAGARVTFVELIGMKFRKVNAGLVVEQRITAKQAGIDLPVRELEAHYLALGGRGRGEQMIPVVVRSLITAHKAGADVQIRDLESFQLAGGDVPVVTNALVAAVKATLTIQVGQLQAHFLAQGNVQKVVNALISAMRAGIPLDFQKAAAIDLAGRDVEEAVRISVHPKVIDCPKPGAGKDTVAGVAKDGIEVKAKARVTVRANIDRLIGGATEDTIIARVGEGIVTTIGSAASHKAVLENPDSISKVVLEKGLDAGTAFEILSIDIGDVDVGQNIGARLQTDQAEADKKVAQAKAEERYALARAREQEMNAVTQENRAKVVLAEAEIPKAISQAFREGNLGIMDYYRLRNIRADTAMRQSIGGEKAEDESQS
ncbi:MAG: flotillin-like protein FloA [Candidatus Brocadiia bacterium]